MFTHIDDFMNALQRANPAITSSMVRGFKASLGGKVYFEDLVKLKERFDLFVATGFIENGKDDDIVTPTYNGVDLTVETLRMLSSTLGGLDELFTAERDKTTQEVSKQVSDSLAEVTTTLDAKVGEVVDSKITTVTDTVDTKIATATSTINSGIDSKITAVTNSVDTKIADLSTAVDDVIEAEKVATSQLVDTKTKDVSAQADLRYEQADFVQLLARYNYYPNMVFRKISTTKWEVILYGNGRHLTYEFFKSSDDMIIQTKVTVGTYTQGLAPVTSVSTALPTYTDFTLKPTDGVTGYTTTVGGSFTVDVNVPEDGSSIDLTLYRRETGGLWEFKLDSLSAVQISVFNATTITDTRTIYTNVPKGTYKFTGNYLGSDPQNPVEANRGWIPKTNEKFIQVNSPSIVTTPTTTLTEPSNKEFAYQFMPKGGTKLEFFPYHGTATAFNAEPPQFLNGQVAIDQASMLVGQTSPITEFTLSQHLYGRHPESGDTNLLEAYCNTRIKAGTGQLSIDGKIKALADIVSSGSYVIMGTARGDVFDRVITSFNNEYVGTVEGYGTNIAMSPERDWAKSFAFISPVNKDFAIGYRYNDIKRTLRQGESLKNEPSAMTYMQNRDATLKKIYSRLYANNVAIPTGHTIRFSGDYIFAVSKNLYNVLSVN